MLYTFIKNSIIFCLLLPGIISVLVMASGSCFGRQGSFILTTSSMGFICTSILLIVMSYIFTGSILTYKYFFWVKIGFFTVQWGFLFDGLSCIMLLIVSIISFLVHFYSIGYMAADPHANRFMAYLSLFTFFMFLLVSSDNLLQLFLGWEGVGLCSYLLISFWYTRIAANKAAIKALIVNRVGDIALLFAMAMIYHQFKTLDYATIFSICRYFDNLSVVYFNCDVKVLNIISVCLFIGAVGKSAQLGLHTWLPDAMEGPTPVSALIHAATMVTAGVFLLIRCSPLLECAPMVLMYIALVGGLTTFFAASIGITQTDIKKIIAYSTCSQLGYMILACGLSNYILAIYHLLTHAFFKALLFLSAGAIIHAVDDEQDFRKMGGFLYLLPLVYSTMLIGSCAIMGVPFLAGFYSKDLILEANFLHSSFVSNFLQILIVVSTGLTIIYSLKLLFHVFLTAPNNNKMVYIKMHEPSITSYIVIPLVLLAICSIFSGYLFQDVFTVLGNSFFNNAIVSNTYVLEMEYFDTDFKLYIFRLTLVVIAANVCYYIFFVVSPRCRMQQQNIFAALTQNWANTQLEWKTIVAEPAFKFRFNSLKKKKDLPLLNIWWDFYCLKIAFLPIMIQNRWFKRPVSAAIYHSFDTDQITIYTQQQVIDIINRPIWNYKYPMLEKESIFFNFSYVFFMFYIASFLFVTDLCIVWSEFANGLRESLGQNQNDNIPPKLQRYLYWQYKWRSATHIKKYDSEQYFNIWYDFYILRFLLVNIKIITMIWPTYRLRDLEYFKLPRYNSQVYSAKDLQERFLHQYKLFDELDIFFNLKKKNDLPLLNIWWDFYCLKIAFLPIMIQNRWFKRPVSAAIYHSFDTDQITIYTQQQVIDIINRPIWNYKYPMLEKESIFFNCFFFKNQPAAFKQSVSGWYTLWFKSTDSFSYFLFFFIGLVWNGFYLNRFYKFWLRIFNENVNPKLQFGYSNLLLQTQQTSNNLSFDLVKRKQYLQTQLYISRNMQQVVDVFFLLRNSEKTLWFAGIKKKNDLPLLNIWWDFYCLKIAFLPIMIQNRWFKRPVSAAIYHSFDTDQITIYTQQQVIDIINRPIWNYKYPMLEKESIFFNCFFPLTYNMKLFLEFLGMPAVFFEFLLLQSGRRHTFSTFFFFFDLWFTAVLTVMLPMLVYLFGFLLISTGVNFARIWFFRWQCVKAFYYRSGDINRFTKIVRRGVYEKAFALVRVYTAIFVDLCVCLYSLFVIPRWGNKGYYYVVTFLSKKWFIDAFQNKLAYFVLLKIYPVLYLLLEKGIFEVLGPYGLTRRTIDLGKALMETQKNKISFFVLSMFYSCIIIYFFIFYAN